MTTTVIPPAGRAVRRARRRLAATALTVTLGLGSAGASLAVITSPRVTGGDRQVDVAIPGVRGTGGGGGTYGVSAMVLSRKAGGGVQEY